MGDCSHTITLRPRHLRRTPVEVRCERCGEPITVVVSDGDGSPSFRALRDRIERR